MVMLGAHMSDFSIAEAKSHFAQLVQQAESGQAVRITRRGLPVAVMVSGAEYERLAARQDSPRDSLFDFTTRLRLEAAAAGLPLFEDADLQGLRDHSDRSPQTDWA
jgi:prevent-host-death family protein